MESAIVAGMGLDTPLHQKSLKTNLENIAGDMFSSTMEQKMILMPCPELFNCRFRASGQDGWTRFSKIFLGRLASTYATLQSFTNLKRWRITTEAMCILCSKDVRTTAHILGACELSLHQGRYTFRHDKHIILLFSHSQTFCLVSNDWSPQNFHFK